MFPQVVHGTGFLLGASMLLGLVGPAAAQERSESTFPITPEPAECRVPARPVEDLIPIFTEPGEAPAAAETLDEARIPLGYPAGPERAAEVTVTVREAIACFNAGDILRATALFTDDGLRRFFGPWVAEEPWTEADVRQMTSMAGPVPVDERQTILGIANVARLTDGRLTAIAVLDDPLDTSGQPQALFVYFARTDGRWLIDDFDELSRI